MTFEDAIHNLQFASLKAQLAAQEREAVAKAELAEAQRDAHRLVTELAVKMQHDMVAKAEHERETARLILEATRQNVKAMGLIGLGKVTS